MKFLQSAEWARRLTPCSCSRRSPSLRPWEGRETFNRCSLSGLLPLRVEAPDLLVVMKFSLMFMAFMAFSSSVMSMVRFFCEFRLLSQVESIIITVFTFVPFRKWQFLSFKMIWSEQKFHLWKCLVSESGESVIQIQRKIGPWYLACSMTSWWSLTTSSESFWPITLDRDLNSKKILRKWSWKEIKCLIP